MSSDNDWEKGLSIRERMKALDALTAESQKLGLYDLDITLLDGKYRIVANSDMTGFRALRYGEEWRDLTGDKLVLALVHEVIGLRERVNELRDSR